MDRQQVPEGARPVFGIVCVILVIFAIVARLVPRVRSIGVLLS
jgi:hypothetical protein